MQIGILIISRDDLIISSADKKAVFEKLKLRVASKCGLELKFKKVEVPKQKDGTFVSGSGEEHHPSLTCKKISKKVVSYSNEYETCAI